MLRVKARKRSSKAMLATELECVAPHLFMNPMMTEYEYVVMKGAALAPHVGGDVKLCRLLLEFILDCGIPAENYCTWKQFPQFKSNWNYDFEWPEHYKVHGPHACVIYDPPVKPKRKLRKMKSYVYQ